MMPIHMVASNHSRAREALAQIEKAYADGRLTRGQYLSQREQLHRMLQLPVMAKSAVAENAKGFFMKNLIDNSPAPVGYFNDQYNGRPTRKYHTFWNTTGVNQENIRAPTRRMAPINNVKASLLEMQKEEYWNWEGDLNNVLRKNMMSNNGLTNQSEVNQMNENNHLSHYQDTQLQVNGQLGRLGVTKVDENNYPQVMQVINNQKEVQVALQNLLDSIERAVVKQVNAGWNQQQATASIINLARQAGAKLNAYGYDPEAARSVIGRLVSGEITELGAIYAVAGDLKEASNIINGIGNNANGTMTANSGLFNNNLPQASTAPPASNAIAAPVMRNNVSSVPYATLDLPTLKNMYENAQNNAEAARIKQAINYRQEAMNAVKRGNSVNTIVAPSMARSGNAAQQAIANNPALQYSKRAKVRQSPDVMRVVKDIMTIDGNLIFDYTAGKPILIKPDGSFEKYMGSMSQQGLLNQQIGNQIRPEGEWSVLTASMPQIIPGTSLRQRIAETMKFGITMLEQIKRDLNYAMASPHWDDNARGYLIYLLNKTLEQIDKIQNPLLEPVEQEQIIQQQQQQQQQQKPVVQNNYLQQKANNYVQNKFEAHNHYKGQDRQRALSQKMNNSLHQKGYTHNRPKTTNKPKTINTGTGTGTGTGKGGVFAEIIKGGLQR